MRKRLSVGMMMLALLCGCSTTYLDRVGAGELPAMDALAACDSKDDCKGETVRRKHAALKDYGSAQTFCRRVLNYYERAGRSSGGTKFWIGAVGTLAGSVIAPALTAGAKAKSAIAAFSGVSGAANALQTDVEDGPIGARMSYQLRAAVADFMHEAELQPAVEDGPEEIERKARVLAGKCFAPQLKNDNGGS